MQIIRVLFFFWTVISTKCITPPEQNGKHSSSHQPFPNEVVTFEYFQHQIDLLASLMRPKKIGIKGSDGVSHAFLAKPKDDLRKDTRMMVR
jgi:serine/threonine-protein kinase ATR